MKKLGWFSGGCALAVSAMIACSSSETPLRPGGVDDEDAGLTRDGSTYDSTPSPESGLGTLLFRPDAIHTGFDGTRTFKVPIAVYDSDADLTVTASDAAAVTIAPTKLKNPVVDGVTDNGKYFLITAKKAGAITLTAKSKGRTATATLTITDYAAGRWAAGEARYTAAGTGADRPCTSCHVNGEAIDHSPASLATASDMEVGIIVTTGVKPGPGGTSSTIVIKSEPETPHAWNVTQQEQDGLVTYLRALEPRGFE
ncbi:MAG: hypothetical protein KF819_29350 [Labilithrix sp.]|nr:hypothetical protein [Labilithrix sp.]